METRNRRVTIQGVVLSVKMAKTIVVEASTSKNDSLYGKRVGYSKKYYAHDEKGIAKEGDTVTIMGCRPLSKLKRFVLVRVDKKASGLLKTEEVEAKLEANEGIAPSEEVK